MVKHLYANFLRDAAEYTYSEQHWIRLWDTVDPQSRAQKGWQQPWFEPLPPSLGEGNPMFSAVSPLLHRGIRIIQHAPTANDLEMQAWLDHFGGIFNDPDSIEELVISCALSDAASSAVLALIKPWVNGEPLEGLASDLAAGTDSDGTFRSSQNTISVVSVSPDGGSPCPKAN
jgi:hypothetical protein